MHKLLRFIPALMVGGSVFITACGKDGAPGPAGEDGAGAEIIYSPWMDVAFKPDTIHLAGGGIDTVGYFLTMPAPKLTLELLNSSDVKVFINTGTPAAPTVIALPYYDPYSGYSIQVTTYEKEIDIYSNGDLTTYTDNAGRKRQQFRYMIVPGNTGARQANMLDWSDYNAVKKHFGIKD
ncbi:hypothetical protein MKQ68_14020 [Chitinophaga horti]|uniref:Lipoprotein n=1 Tax=Chitinophaga horti TaxID=2920382 RepID=A0ABY6IV14_9BACT|nr:hypothetical protein [Chitinophaga horti]UYQ91208.1 hypothetical protein MKQ68_14020 [Chitinophaga horti]